MCAPGMRFPAGCAGGGTVPQGILTDFPPDPDGNFGRITAAFPAAIPDFVLIFPLLPFIMTP